MKKLLVAIALSAVLLLTGCVTTTPSVPATTTTSVIQTSEVVTGTLVPSVAAPTGTPATQYPDDLVPTPGGYAYRGNVNEQGTVNPWPGVVTTETSLPVGSVRYRDAITTNAGQTRNNLIIVSSGTFQSGQHTLDLYAASPAGITLELSDGATVPGQVSKWLRIAVAAGTAPGDYLFSLAVSVDGVYGGILPITVHVVTETVNTPTAPVTTTS